MKMIRCPINRMGLSRLADEPALIGEKAVRSYRQLESDITAYAGYLRQNGIRPASKVALWAASCAEFVVAYFAVLRLGGSSFLISTRLPARRYREECARLGCRAVIVPPSSRRRFPGCVILRYPALTENIPNGPMREKVFYATDALANVMPTSGSSGPPKAVVHTTENHHFSALGANEHIPLAVGDGWLLSLPVYHVAGLSILWRCFTAGAAVVIPDGGRQLAENLQRYPVTHMSCVPAQLRPLSASASGRKTLKAMKAVLLGGSAMPSGLIRTCCRYRLPVYASYGLTEMSSQVATTACLRRPADLSRSTVLKYRKMKIAKDGQIYVRGRTLSPGYWEHGIIRPITDRNGWFATGDRGEITGQGAWRIIGRLDRMFISGGENIYPEEIERALQRIPSVLQACVFPRPSPQYGQRPVAVIRFQSGQRLTVSQIRHRLARRIERFKVPDQFYAWPASLTQELMKTNWQGLRREINRHGMELR